ncbi:hypothetical protein LTR49_028635, partial [Elasticomyces elasticus]
MTRPPRLAVSTEGTAAEHIHKRVTIHHPGYEGDNDILIELLAADGANGGLDFETMHTVCAMVAGNCWDGYFSRTKAVDASPVEADEEGLLAPGDYFFHVPPPPS